jgi:hypothetical protein
VYKQWHNVALPVKFGQMLDEQLDYAIISLIRVKKRYFEPLTRAKLVITSTTENGGTQTKETQYFIANDNFTETPVGSGVYNHEIALIELTKFLECFHVESLCFTNPNGNVYKFNSSAPSLLESESGV